MDGDSREISEPDQPGELCYRGPYVMIGYAETVDDLATAETLDELRTGDIGCRNAEGLYYLVGRSARFVKLFGMRIGLDDLESYARARGIAAACTGTDDKIVVAVVGAPLDQPAKRDFAEGLMIPLKHFVFLACSEIPRLGNGKVDYQTLLAQAERVET